MSQVLRGLIGKPIRVVTTDGRILVGILEAFDQTTNLVIASTEERIFSTEEPYQTEQLGLYMLRGDNIAMVCETDVEADSAFNWDEVRTEPLEPFRHYH